MNRNILGSWFLEDGKSSIKVMASGKGFLAVSSHEGKVRG